MNDESPYRSPHDREFKEESKTLATIGVVLASVGAVCLSYSALAFWIFKSLPPNGGIQGRLPSLYGIFLGIAVLITGLSIRSYGKKRAQVKTSPGKSSTISTSTGIVILIAILILAFAALSQL